jgi:hypothetical protein
LSSFAAFKAKPVSSKVVLLEFASSIQQSFFLNEESGIWRYKWRVEADTTYNYENGAFCYGCFKQECSGYRTNGNPRVNFISVKVDGENYSKVTTLANLRTTNKSFWWDGETIHIHFDNFDPPWIFQTITLGAAVTLANKAGIYDELYYDGRLKSLTPLDAKVDPLFYGLIGYSGTAAVLSNEDGEFDNITVFDLYGQTVNILFGEEGTAYTDFELMFSGIIQDFTISYSELRLNIKDKRKKFKRSVPQSFFDSTTYPYISAKNENKPIPLAYGYCDNIPVICTNEDEGSPASYQFKICDTTFHGIKAIDAVRVKGIAKTPTASSLANATFELATADYSPGDDVNADIQGYEDTGTLIENALDVIVDLLENYGDIAYTTDNYDTTEWVSAQASAPNIQYFIPSSATIESVIEKICLSLNGVMFAKSNGKFTFKYLHAAKSITETLEKSEFFEGITANYPSDKYVSTIVLTYDKDYGENKLLTYIDDSLEQTLLDTYDISYRYEAETVLRSLADVQTLATNLLNTYAKIAQWVTLMINISHIQLELIDDVTAELDRRNKTWFGDTDMRVYGIRKDVMGGKVELTLRKI